MKLYRSFIAAGVIAFTAIASAQAADISGAGASFPYPIYTKWADAYKKETGIGLNYQSIGSGGGIKQIKAKTVTFGASDMPLKATDLDESGLVQFPTVLGGVVPVVNLPGIKPGELVLDGPTAAKIFLGEIKTWNDPAIRSSIQREPPLRTRSQSSIARTAPARPSSSPTTSRRSAPSGSRRSVPTRRSNGRPASAPRAMKASPTMSPRPRARLAMSNMRMPSRTS